MLVITKFLIQTPAMKFKFIRHHSLKIFMQVWYAINSIYSSFVMQNYHLYLLIHSLQNIHIYHMHIKFSEPYMKEIIHFSLHTFIVSINFLAISSLLLSHKRKSFNVLYYFHSVWCLLLCCFCSFLTISNCHYLYGRIIRTKGSRLWESSFSHFL